MSIFQFLKSKALLKQLLYIGAGLVFGVFFLYWFLGVITHHDQKIQVPNLQKMTLSEVAHKLTELDITYVVIDSTSYNPAYPKKSVIEQSPVAGSFVKEKRKIYLTLNPSKYKAIILPDVYGRSKRQAMKQLRATGFLIDETFTYVPDLGKDVVRGVRFQEKKVRSGTTLPKYAVLQLVLGDGKKKN